MVDASFLEGLIIGFIIFLVAFVLIGYRLLKSVAAKKLEKWKLEELNRAVSKSLEKERPIIKGKISEQLFPLLYDKAGKLSDMRFIGSPIDYVLFDGLSDARDGAGKDVNIKFIEIKTGEKAQVNKAESLVKDAVQKKRVSWEEIRL